MVKAARQIPLSREARANAGRMLRKKVARTSHRAWQPFRQERDPIAILRETDQGRLPDQLPIRYGRMLKSPFAFLRGSAAVMAFDLARAPQTGIAVQACGDCHLMNFGGFATPERNLVFDLNDFDETLPASWEWDIKRLSASIMVAGRSSGLAARACTEAVVNAARTYREKLTAYSLLPALEVWHATIDARRVVELGSKRHRRQTQKLAIKRAHIHGAGNMLPKLTELVDGKRRIKDDPPLVYHASGGVDYEARAGDAIAKYRASLPDERRPLFDRYHLADIARKVIGVGSVGTRCAIALFFADGGDALFLQFKEARASVLEPYAGASRYRSHAQRIVVGQRLMQSASDIFLGWSSTGRPAFDFYVRQLRNVKTSVNLDDLAAADFVAYARYCAWALARAHAKTGDAAMISGYLGRSDAFDLAMMAFASAYADQTERDHLVLVKAVRSGQLIAEQEV
jgi:uncharacterized protein (DUF2252 family)